MFDGTTLSLIVDINRNASAGSLRLITVPDQLEDNSSGTTLRQPAADLRRATMKILVKFLKDESGATAVEYGLIAAGISVAIIAVVQGVGTRLNTTFQPVSTALR